MNFRLLIPILAFAVLSLSACDKGKDTAGQQASPGKSAVQEEKAASAPMTETAKDAPAAPKAGQ